MRTLSGIVAALMALGLVIFTTSFWSNLHGPIGFWGSIFTIPFSTLLGLVALMFQGVPAFIFYSVYTLFFVMFFYFAMPHDKEKSDFA